MGAMPRRKPVPLNRVAPVGVNVVPHEDAAVDDAGVADRTVLVAQNDRVALGDRGGAGERETVEVEGDVGGEDLDGVAGWDGEVGGEHVRAGGGDGETVVGVDGDAGGIGLQRDAGVELVERAHRRGGRGGRGKGALAKREGGQEQQKDGEDGLHGDGERGSVISDQ